MNADICQHESQIPDPPFFLFCLQMNRALPLGEPMPKFFLGPDFSGVPLGEMPNFFSSEDLVFFCAICLPL